MVTTMLTFTSRRLEMYSQIKFRKSQYIRPPQLGRFRSYSFFNVRSLKSPSGLTKINDLQYIAKAIQRNIKPTFNTPHSKLYLLFTLLPRYIYIPYILKQWIVFEFATPFKEVSPQELNKCLQKFYLSVRKSDDHGRSVIARQNCNRWQQ